MLRPEGRSSKRTLGRERQAGEPPLGMSRPETDPEHRPLKKRDELPTTAEGLRLGITDTERRIDGLLELRSRLHARLAEVLCPVAVGDRFTAQGEARSSGGSRFTVMHARVTREDEFEVVEVQPRGHGLRDVRKITWEIVARRVLANGALSQKLFRFTKKHRVRKTKGGGR